MKNVRSWETSIRGVKDNFTMATDRYYANVLLSAKLPGPHAALAHDKSTMPSAWMTVGKKGG
jgi:hypothetical protein